MDNLNLKVILSGEGLRIEKSINLKNSNFDECVLNIKRFLAVAEQIEKENTK